MSKIQVRPDDILMRPNPKQAEFFSAKTRYVAYGGARGGGKSWAVRALAMLLGDKYPGIRLLIVRRTYPDLEENHIAPLRDMYTQLGEGSASYNDSKKLIRLPNGSTIKFGYSQTEEDAIQYQGREYDVIFIDEATQFTERQFNYIKMACRGANKFPKRMYLTCNPGGVSHAWVKRLFIDKEYHKRENAKDYTFIPARATDNKRLMDTQPEYLEMLDELPDGLREAWRDGDWDVYEGQYFTEFKPGLHVYDVAAFPIPESWPRYFSLDYGLDGCAGLWVAVSPDDKKYVYRELFGKNMIISSAAEHIRSRSVTDTVRDWYAPPDLWSRSADTGRSQIEQFGEHGLFFSRASNDRVAGWIAVKEEFQADTLFIANTCTNLIKCLPLLQYDDKKSNGDVKTEPHDITHLPDALRYFVSTWRTTSKPEEKQYIPDPFRFVPVRERDFAPGYGERVAVI